MKYYHLLAVLFGPLPILAQTFTDNGIKSFSTDQIAIGTTDPGSYQLRIDGPTYQNGSLTFSTVDHAATNSTTHLAFPAATDGFYIITQQLQSDQMEVLFRMRDNITGDFFKIWFDDYRGSTYDRYPLMVSGERVFLVNNAGAVGIGTTTIPSGYKLAVDGKAIMEEVKVEVSGSWPDHVFHDDHQISSLENTESYIRENKHLPGIPSAEEVKEDGVSLGEMNAKLLEKIEELTLHVIELNKKNGELEERLSNLEKTDQ